MKSFYYCGVVALLFLVDSVVVGSPTTLSDLADKHAQLLNELYEKNRPDVLLNDAQEIVYGGLHDTRAKIAGGTGDDFWSKFDAAVQVFFRNHRRNPERIGEDFKKFVLGFQKKNKGLVLTGRMADVFDTGISDIEIKLKDYFKDRPGLKATVLDYLFPAPLKYLG